MSAGMLLLFGVIFACIGISWGVSHRTMLFIVESRDYVSKGYAEVVHTNRDFITQSEKAHRVLAESILEFTKAIKESTTVQKELVAAISKHGMPPKDTT